MERVHVLANISRSRYVAIAINATRAPIANPPNNAQLEGTPTIPPRYQVRAVVWACGTDCDGHTHTHTDKQTRVNTIHSRPLRLTRDVHLRSTGPRILLQCHAISQKIRQHLTTEMKTTVVGHQTSD